MSLERQKNMMRSFLFAIASLTLVFSAVRTFILVEMVDPKTEFYAVDSFLPTAFSIASVVIIVVVLLLKPLFRISYFEQTGKKSETPTEEMDFMVSGEGESIIAKFKQDATAPADTAKKEREYLPLTKLIFLNDSAAIIFLQVFLAFVFVSVGALGIYSNSSLIEPSMAVYVSSAASFLAGIFYFSTAARKINYHASWFSLVSLAPVIFAGIRFVNAFLNLSSGAQASAKLFEILSLAFLLVFFLLEAKFTLPLQKAHKFSLYFVIGMLTVFTLFVSSLPQLIWKIYLGMGLDVSLMFLILEIFISLYVFVKLYTTVKQLNIILE